MRPAGPGSAGLPCSYSRFSLRLGRWLPLRPLLRCRRDCARCAWNRAEQERRLRSGVWRRGADGLLRLHFPPAPAKANKEERA